MTPIAIDEALRDPALLGAALDMRTRATWNVALKAIYARPLDEAEREIFHQIAGNRNPPTKRVREAWFSVGRRGDKSEMSAGIGVYEALFVPHRLSRGETGMVLIIAGSKDQAKIVFNYAKGIIDGSAVLRREIANIKANEITFKNKIVLAVHSNSFRTVRGRTVVAAIFDEIGFWRDEDSANPDLEVFRAVVPAMATTNGILIGISTPYRRMGLLYQRHRDYFGVDGDDVLALQGPTRLFNPTLSETTIAAAMAADPEGARSEWDAVFRFDKSGFLLDRDIEDAVDPDRPLELPPQRNTKYVAVCDPSNGRHDAMTLCIAHRNADGVVVVDLCRGRPAPFDPKTVVEESAT